MMSQINLATLMLTLLRNQGGGSVNTAVPELSTATPVIGTAITITPGTWTGSPTLTYQWQRNTGSWADISGATNDTYTPVDADFGYALRVVETANGTTSANSAATANLTREAPAQSLGAEALTNGDFSAWTADNPDWWTNDTESGSDPMVTQVAADGSAGTGAARLYSSGTGRARLRKAGVLTVGQPYYAEIEVSAYTSGAFFFQEAANTQFVPSITAARTFCGVVQAANAEPLIQSNTGSAQDAVFNAVSLKPITVNAELTAPSADMQITALFTAPGTPKVGSRLLLPLRISNYPAGNYLYAFLLYNTSLTYEVRLFSVAGYTATQLIAPVTSLGALNGLRVNANGNSISMFTTTDSGSNWTQRGSTVTHSTYNTATKANVIWTPGFTMNSLIYAPAA